MRWIDLDHFPEAAMVLALSPGHVVLDATAWREIVPGERGGMGRWPPPALQLARIVPQLPHTLRRGWELRFDGQGEPLWILADGDDGHWLLCSPVSAMRS